jgi:spermidine synthase
VVDLAAPAGEPVRALHLGAGALTLARYIQATRPGSVQYAVELERELLDFVLQQLPMPDGTELHTLIGDARDALAELPAELRFDVVILDIFSGPEAPEHIACTAFYAEAAAKLTPRGLRRAMPGVSAFAESSMFAGRHPGNIVLIGTQGPWPVGWTEELTARGPHPARVLAGVDLDALSR